MTKKHFVALIIIFAGVWYFWGRGWMARRADQSVQSMPEVTTANVITDHNPSLPPLTFPPEADPPRAERGTDAKARVHYFTKEALAECSKETVAVEQAVDAKYGHQGAGALVAMSLPLPVGVSDTYMSALAQGTRLLTMRIDRDGVAHADYNNNLNNALSDCAKSQRRAQIESTLREFSEIKSVVITVEGKVWE